MRWSSSAIPLNGPTSSVPPRDGHAREVRGVGVGDEVQQRHDDQVVPVEVGSRRDDVGRDARPPERLVVRRELVRHAQERARHRVRLAGPQRRPVEDERDAGVHRGADDRPQPAQQPALLADGAMQVGVRAGVREHRRVEPLGALRRGPPLEVADRVRAVRDRAQRVPQHPAGGLGQVVRAPAHRAGSLLEQRPRPAAADPAGQVVGERRARGGRRVGRVGVVVVGDDVEVVRPGELVDQREEAHRVRRDGSRRGARG